MATRKYGWADGLQAAKSKGSRQNDYLDKIEAKVKSRSMYLKRKLDKDIKPLLKQRIIHYGDIVRIHKRHGIKVVG